jgi:hypothetical protein
MTEQVKSELEDDDEDEEYEDDEDYDADDDIAVEIYRSFWVLEFAAREDIFFSEGSPTDLESPYFTNEQIGDIEDLAFDEFEALDKAAAIEHGRQWIEQHRAELRPDDAVILTYHEVFEEVEAEGDPTERELDEEYISDPNAQVDDQVILWPGRVNGQWPAYWWEESQ